jgi:ornithine cyclodeaminase
MKDIEFLYLNQDDIRSVGITMKTAMETVEDAFRLHYQKKTNLPYKTVLDLGERERGRGNAMPGYVGGDYDVFGIKWIAGFPKNPVQHGLPRATGFTILNDSWTGVPLAVMDCTLLSAMRTGAVTGVGAKYMARADSKNVAIIGTGVQARMQLEALKTAIPGLEEVRAYDIRSEASEKFALDMSEKFSLKVYAVETAEEAVRESDIVVTVTVADEPIVKNAWMKTGSFFSAVGSYQEEEFDVVTDSDKVVVDGLMHVLHRETPVIALMIKKGLINEKDVIELSRVVAGEVPGRTDPEERVFFSPIGMAIVDVCLSFRVYKIAKQNGIGKKLGLFGVSSQ